MPAQQRCAPSFQICMQQQICYALVPAPCRRWKCRLTMCLLKPEHGPRSSEGTSWLSGCSRPGTHACGEGSSREDSWLQRPPREQNGSGTLDPCWTAMQRSWVMCATSAQSGLLLRRRTLDVPGTSLPHPPVEPCRRTDGYHSICGVQVRTSGCLCHHLQVLQQLLLLQVPQVLGQTSVSTMPSTSTGPVHRYRCRRRHHLRGSSFRRLGPHPLRR